MTTKIFINFINETKYFQNIIRKTNMQV